MELKRWFSSPIGIVNFGEMSRDLNTKLIETIDVEMDQKANRDQRSWANNSASTDKNLLSHKPFQMLNQVISLSLKNVMVGYGYREEAVKYITIDYYWANRATQGGWSRPHYHGSGNTLWSGVYYPHGYEDTEQNLDDFNEDDWIFGGGRLPDDPGGFLCLQDTSFTTKGLITPGDKDIFKANSDFSTRKWVKPRQGLLVLFPCWQDHFVEPVSKDETRYSISFGARLSDAYWNK